MSNYLYYLFVINMISFILYGIDKLLAILKKNRISERWLFFLSLIGGPLGCILGMFVFRHKVKKLKFYLWNFIMLIGWCYLTYMFLI